MTVDFPSTNDLTWQEWRSNTSAVESTANSTDRQSDDQFEPHSRARTLANPNVKTDRWSNEELRLLAAMSRERIQRKVIARVLLRSPKAVKTRLEIIR